MPRAWREALEASCRWMGPACAYEEATCTDGTWSIVDTSSGELPM